MFGLLKCCFIINYYCDYFNIFLISGYVISGYHTYNSLAIWPLIFLRMPSYFIGWVQFTTGTRVMDCIVKLSFMNSEMFYTVMVSHMLLHLVDWYECFVNVHDFYP